jgi:hypothetical protein
MRFLDLSFGRKYLKEYRERRQVRLGDLPPVQRGELRLKLKNALAHLTHIIFAAFAHERTLLKFAYVGVSPFLPPVQSGELLLKFGDVGVSPFQLAVIAPAVRKPVS